jgi:hypothetical protein
MSQQNAVQQRKEAKPKKVFTINAIVYDDGIVSGTCIEYRDLGRLKNQKCIVPDHEEFMSCVRSLVPSSVDTIERLSQQIFDDIDVHDTELCEKIGRVVVDIYNDGYIDCDFGEVIQGQRGAPKTWRLTPNSFFDAVESRVGQLTSPFKALIENAGNASTIVNLNTHVDEGEDVEEELQENENEDKLETSEEDEN